MENQRDAKQKILAGASEEDRNPERWPEECFVPLEHLLARSLEKAGKAVRETFGRRDRSMSAREFVRFWNRCPLKAMATASPHGSPHIAPVHAEFVRGVLYSTIYVEAQRLRDLESNPRVALTTWDADGAVAIVRGRARVVPGSERESRPGAGGQPRRTVLLEIALERMYAMKGRPHS